MKNLFNRYWKEYDKWYEKNRPAYLSEIKAIKKVFPAGGKGLEIGVGTGRFASALGIKHGIDPSKKMIAIAKKRDIKAVKGYGENLPYKNSEFDYVLIINTLCFAKNPEAIVKETGRVLKEGGTCIIGILDKNSFLGEFYMKQDSPFYKDINLFSVKEVIGLLKSCNFEQSDIYQTVFDYPSNIKSIQKPEKGYGKGGFVVCSFTKL
ncbi:MAG: class I SAM-dependent methyltransferase [Elusimicrobiota bacterium]